MSEPRILMVVPASLYDPKDPFTTGVVYMPIGLAYGVSALIQSKMEVKVLDMFGESPKQVNGLGSLVRLGIGDDILLREIELFNPEFVIFYANQLVNHQALIESTRTTKRHFPDKTIVVVENTQAVTAYQVTKVAQEFFSNGADILLSGEMEVKLIEIINKTLEGIPPTSLNIDGVSVPNRIRFSLEQIPKIDDLLFPSWNLFPIKNYWDLGYAHGPMETDSYLPLLTSRGCPFPCKFCVIPATNNRKWRFRNASNVVDEIQFMIEKYGVKEFHIEDLNPTISDRRMQDIATDIIARGLDIKWKIVAGTKIETIKSIETMSLLSRSGLKYVSMSPESGSTRVQREIGKMFDVGHAIKQIRFCRRSGIFTQACFVLGFPSETERDRLRSLGLALKMTLAGVDEIVVFIMTPVPGSATFDQFQGQYESLSALTFSPRWRSDFTKLLLWRVIIYSGFLLTKFLSHPFKILRQLRNLLSGRYETKMEMVPLRGLKYLRLSRSTLKYRSYN